MEKQYRLVSHISGLAWYIVMCGSGMVGVNALSGLVGAAGTGAHELGHT